MPLLSKGRRIVYGLSVTLVMMLAVTVYLGWWWHTTMSVPDFVTARVGFYREDIPVRAVLLWIEDLVVAPARGSIQYRHGSESAFVAKGEVVATVLKGGKNLPVMASKKGYFVPGLDGLEKSWRYSSIWTEPSSLPDVPDLEVFPDFSESRSDRIIGKLIHQPQTLRCIMYCPVTDQVRSEVDLGLMEFRLDPLGAPFTGNVRVAELMGHKMKIYMDLPFFPIEMASRRDVTLYVKGGEWSGAEVPESSVVIRHGKRGVFVIRGDRVFFREVTGIPMSGNRFLVQTGLKPGNLVLLNGMVAEEGRIRLW